MAMTDPISDLLTQIRNAISVRKRSVVLPHSKIKLAICQLLQRQGYIVEVTAAPGKTNPKLPGLKIALKYSGEAPVIKGLRRVSKPGQRIYTAAGQIRPVLNGAGVAVVSTSKGLLTDREARAQGIGGEILFKIW